MTRRHVSLVNLMVRRPCATVLAMLAAATMPAGVNAMPVALPAVTALPNPDMHPVADLGGAPPPHRNVYRISPGIQEWGDAAAWDQIFREADGAINTAIIDPRRKDFYRQNYFYGGTPYYGRQFYGAPVYYGGPYYTYYVHE